MSALIVPVNPLPAQTLSVVLSGQQIDISLSARGAGLYADVFMANVPIVLARPPVGATNGQVLLMENVRKPASAPRIE